MYLAWAVAAFLAYQALSPTATYLLGEQLWAFQILFLFLVLFPMVMFALTVYHSVGVVAAPRPSSAPVESAPVVGVTSSATQACRACGAPNLAGAKFCEVCGAPLAAGSAVPQVAAPVVLAPSPVVAAASVDAQPTPLAPALDLATPQTCPHCGAQNLPQAVFCEGCGQSLAAAPAGGKACPTCGAPNLPEAKFCEACGAALAEEVVAELCRTCGHANPKGSTFCKHCGAALVMAEDETQDVPAPAVLCEACGAECVPTARFCAICGHTLGSPATKGTPAAPGADPDITADPGALQNPATDPDITVDPAALGNPAPGSTEPPTMPIQ
jgi:predicted amidophosphoribosyltransferase